mgnify:CR=1 FL=1
MIEYGLKKGLSSPEKRKNSDNRNNESSLDMQNFLMDQDEEYLERFDSRGKKMKLRRGKVAFGSLRHI